MSQPTGEHVIEGPKDAPLCPASGIYVGLLAGHRTDCTDCGKRIKVVRAGYLAEHRAWPPAEDACANYAHTA